MTLSLFDWQRALHASPVPVATKLAGLRICLDSAQATGRDVVVDDAQVAADLGVSRRTVWRRVAELLEHGWLVQTAKPTYGGAERAGRRARYQLLIPGLSSATTLAEVAHDSPVDNGVVCQPQPVESHTTPHQSSDTGPLNLSDDTPSRVPNPAQSSATTTLTDGALQASDGSSKTAAAAAAVIDTGPIDILASKIRQHTPLRGLRFDRLGDNTQPVLDLIALHGDQALVDYAITTCREPYPTFAQAFLLGWQSMPPPGRRLALVKPGLCPIHTQQLTPSGRCLACETDAKVGDRA